MTGQLEQIYCQRCGERLNAKRARWLELDSPTGRYFSEGKVAPDRSQGFFPFGTACARAQLAEESRT